MARPDPALTPIQAFLAPLEKLAAKHPLIEAQVYWESSGWPVESAEALEAEEIAFYAEGLLEEGFHLDWRILALPATPDQPDHVQLYLWEEGAAPPPAPAADLPLLGRGLWPKVAA